MSEKTKNKPNYVGRRLAVAGLIGAIGIGGAGLGVELKQEIHHRNEISRFDNPNIIEKIVVDESNKNSPTSIYVKDSSSNIRIPVTIHNIQPGETPIDVANGIGAVDTERVADLVARQSGGAGNLQPGEHVAIPLELLNPPK